MTDTTPQCPEGLYNPDTDTLIRCDRPPGQHEWHESERGVQWRDPMWDDDSPRTDPFSEAPADAQRIDTTGLTPEREQEIRESVLGEWYDGPWTQDYVESDGDDPAYNAVYHHESGTVLATLPDFAGPIALFVADAHDAVPELLAELDRVRAERDQLKAITVNARQLSGHWLRHSAEALSGSQVDAMRTDPYGAGMRLGWANQASDCANELRDVLDGEDADAVTDKSAPCGCDEMQRANGNPVERS